MPSLTVILATHFLGISRTRAMLYGCAVCAPQKDTAHTYLATIKQLN